MKNVNYFGFVSSKYSTDQEGWGFIELPYDNTILYLSAYPFVFVAEEHYFDSLDTMSDYFNDNATDEEVLAVVATNGKERFYRCLNDQCIDVTNEIKNRIMTCNQIELMTKSDEINTYINDDTDSLFYVQPNSYGGIDGLLIDKLRFANTAGETIAFRALKR